MAIIFKKVILVMNKEDGIYDEELFLSYLKDPHKSD